MLIHINAAKCVGIDAVPVTVEVDVINGIGIHLVGLADVAVKESLLRTVTALQSMGFHIPGKKIVINLAPAHLPKSGSGYDVPIALGIIAASQQRDLPGLGRYIIMGELGLDGSVREVPGALPMVELAGKQGLSGAILPVRSAMEAVENRDTLLFGVETLADVLAILEEKEDPAEMLIWNTPRFQQAQRQAQQQKAAPSYMDFADIIGQEGAKRAIEIAAAGGHNLAMVGAPGAGKSSLARALAGILPPMTTEEALQTSKIYSVAGKRSGEVFGLIRERPFRSPHYSASLPAIVGGGGGDNILPGEITLAHHGVLFLDELAQMPKATIEALRGPLEDRKVTISRLRMKLEYPASFMLVAASNPCPCGYYGEGDRCTCTAGQRTNYLSRLSGPIMDRIDIHLWLHPVDPKQRAGGCPGGRGTRPPARTLRGYGHLYQCRNVRQAGGTVLPAVGRLPRPAGDPDAPDGAFRPCLYPHPEAVAHHRRPAGGGRRNASGRHLPRASDRGVIVPFSGPSRPVGPLGFSFLRKSPYLYTLYG